MKYLPFTLVCFLLLGAVVRADPSDEYRVEVDGRPVPTEKAVGASAAEFSFDGSAEVVVRTAEPVRRFTISPKSAGIAAQAEGAALKFRLDRPRPLVIRANDGKELFLFADPIDHEAPKPGQPGVVDIRSTGIDATGRRVETARLQQAIDRTAATHGTLYFSPGVYLTGMLRLPSDANLYLAAGAVVLGSVDPADYPYEPPVINYHPDPKADPDPYFALGADESNRRLILIDHAHHVRIAGRGVIDGQGKRLYAIHCRPNLVVVRSSSDVTFDGVTLRDPSGYNSHPLASDHVRYLNVKILNDRSVFNTDGIDPDGTSDVLIDGCFFCCGDDCVSIKTSGNRLLLRDAERITVRNSVFLSTVSLSKIGNESYADIRDVTFDNLDLISAPRVIDLSSMDGGQYERMRFTNIRVESLGYGHKPIPLMLHLRERPVHERPGFGRMGWIHDIVFRNVTIDDPRPFESKIDGFSPGHDVRNVRFESLRIGGRLCRTAADAHMKIGKYCSEIEFGADAARRRPAPARHGYFFVGGKHYEAGGKTYLAGQMYVRWFKPAAGVRPYPIVMIHGGGQTGVGFLGTPDGREGWADYFVDRGYTVYVVDQPGRGDSGCAADRFGPTRHAAAVDLERRWTAPERYNAFPEAHLHTQWPGDGPNRGQLGDPIFEQFFASQVPSIADAALTLQLNRDAGAALLDRIGPAILLTHSQSGAFGWQIADARPGRVKGIVAVEPASAPDGPGALSQVPILVVTGEASNHAASDVDIVRRLRRERLPVTDLRLAEAGIHGNGHMMMLEKNNLEIADRIAGWVEAEVR